MVAGGDGGMIGVDENGFDARGPQFNTQRSFAAKNCISDTKYHHSAIEAKIIDVVGIATTGLGKAIGSIPVIRDGTVDEALISAGESIGKHNEDTIDRKLNAFSTLEDNRVDPFVENLQSINLLYSTENAMITDGENLYILQSIQ